MANAEKPDEEWMTCLNWKDDAARRLLLGGN
jgi:hypothetical protein